MVDALRLSTLRRILSQSLERGNQKSQRSQKSQMTTLRRFSLGGLSIEASTAWYLSDLGELRGKQAL